MVSLQKESEWEKKWNDGVRPCVWDEVADFITAIVSTREKEIAEEVKKAYQKKSSQLHGGYDDADYLNAYGMAIHDVIQILKH